MNLAVSALAIFLVVLPGMLCRKAFLRGLRGYPVVPRPLVDEVAASVVLAALLHGLWGGLTAALNPLWNRGPLRLTPDLESVAMLLLGEFGKDDEKLQPALRSVTESPCLVILYFLSLYGVSVGVGFLAHAWSMSLQRLRSHWLVGFNKRWFDLIDGTLVDPETGRAPEGSVYCLVAALVEVGGQPYLYEGLLSDAESDLTFDSSGNLYDLTLRGVRRRLLTAADFEPVRGDLFVLRYSDTKTINFNYLELLEVEGGLQSRSTLSGELTVTSRPPPVPSTPAPPL